MHMSGGEGGCTGGEGGCTCILCIPLGTPLSVRSKAIFFLDRSEENRIYLYVN
jgi:hypothetical protein